MQFLKQKWSGRVYVKTDALAQRKDMESYIWPLEDHTSAIDFTHMDKDKLEAYALEKYGVVLNKRKSQDNLVKEIIELRENK